jgi:hypothetical protein
MQLLVYLAVIAITGWLMRLTAQVRGGHAVGGREEEAWTDA